jgi:hypothetical protein
MVRDFAPNESRKSLGALDSSGPRAHTRIRVATLLSLPFISLAWLRASGGTVKNRFDLFEIDADGNAIWLGSTNNLADARNCIEQHASRSATAFCVFDQVNGSKQVFRRNDEILKA